MLSVGAGASSGDAQSSIRTVRFAVDFLYSLSLYFYFGVLDRFGVSTSILVYLDLQLRFVVVYKLAQHFLDSFPMFCLCEFLALLG